MKKGLHIKLNSKITGIILVIMATFQLANATYCSHDMGDANFTIEKMDVTYTEVDPVYNPGKCNAEVHIAGVIKNIGTKKISHINFSTTARSNQGFDSGVKQLAPGDEYAFDITINYSWIDCMSVTELLVLSNGADIKRGSMVCEFPQRVLPVKLISFDYDAIDNGLVWETASEIDNEMFVIEWSKDGVEWSELGTVLGNGTTEYGASYFFPVNNGEGGFFRLKQVDFDGDMHYSEIITVSQINRPSTEEIIVYPNPAQDVLYTNSYEVHSVDIFEMSGRLLKTVPVQDQSIAVSELRPGLYVAVLKTATGSTQTQFIKG